MLPRVELHLTDAERKRAKKYIDGSWDTTGQEPPRKLTRRQERMAAQLHTRELDRLYALRLSLLRELHGEGWTMPQLGKLLGLSKQRVAQLLARATTDDDAD